MGGQIGVWGVVEAFGGSDWGAGGQIGVVGVVTGAWPGFRLGLEGSDWVSGGSDWGQGAGEVRGVRLGVKVWVCLRRDFVRRRLECRAACLCARLHL